MLFERRLTRCVCRIIPRMASCISFCCGLRYGCSGVWKLLIWSVSLGNKISEVPMLNLGMLWMVCFSWRTVTDLQLHRCVTLRMGWPCQRFPTCDQGCEPLCSSVIQCFLSVTAIFRYVQEAVEKWCIEKEPECGSEG